QEAPGLPRDGAHGRRLLPHRLAVESASLQRGRQGARDRRQAGARIRGTMTSLNRNIVRLLVVSLCYAGLPTRLAQAELIATDRLETAGRAPLSARERVDSLFERADVCASLERHGVRAERIRGRDARAG